LTDPPTGTAETLTRASLEKSSAGVDFVEVFEEVLDEVFEEVLDEVFDDVFAASLVDFVVFRDELSSVVVPTAASFDSGDDALAVAESVGLLVSSGLDGGVTATDSALPLLHAANAPPASTVTVLRTTTWRREASAPVGGSDGDCCTVPPDHGHATPGCRSSRCFSMTAENDRRCRRCRRVPRCVAPRTHRGTRPTLRLSRRRRPFR
jgi:hypothetical protein